LGEHVWAREQPAGPRLGQPGARLHAACGFPIVLGGDVLGVIEVFSQAVRHPDPDLVTLMATLGSQIGQCIERQRAEEALR